MPDRVITPAEYLNSLGTLYLQAVSSGEDPYLLRRLGGVFAIAAEDVPSLHVEKNAYLRFIDRNRDPQEVMQLGVQRWSVHKRAMWDRLRAGVSPAQVFEDYMAHYGTVPHSPDDALALTSLQWGNVGQFPAWRYGLMEFREFVQRSAAVMTDTFGGITTGIHLMATAKDWNNPTVDEWNQSLKYGETAVVAGQVAGAVTGGQELKAAGRAAVQGAHAPRANVAVVAPAQNRATGAVPTAAQRGLPATAKSTAAARPAPQQRGTPFVPPAPRNIAPLTKPTTRSTRPAPTVRPAIDVAVDAEVEAAMSEHSAYAGGGRTDINRKKHRKGSWAGRRFQGLNMLIGRMTAQQRLNSQRLLARFSLGLRQVWDASLPRQATAQMEEVRRLHQAGKTTQASKLARKVFNNNRDNFWRAVRRDPALSKQFEDAGMILDPGKDTAPYWQLPNGMKETITVEHGVRLSDSPWQSLDSGHLILSPERENTHTLESIRNKDKFQ